MPKVTKTYASGEVLEYNSSKPFSERNQFVDGTTLHRVYIVQLIPGKLSDKTKRAEVKVVNEPDLFNYDEQVPDGCHVIQAIKQKNGNIAMRLLTGQPLAYGRVIFKFEKNGKRHINILTVRSRLQYEKYMEAAKIVTSTSPGPHRLVEDNGTRFVYQIIGADPVKGQRTIEFVKKRRINRKLKVKD